jgi:hypothetical protein
MGVEHWDEATVESYMSVEAIDWFCHLLNPLPTAGISTPYTRFAIRSFSEISPSSLNLPRWPDRAWSVIVEAWTGEDETKTDQKAAGLLMGTWYDGLRFVDLVEFCVLKGAFDSPVESLHQELLTSFNALESPRKKPMSKASRQRWSTQLDYRGRLVSPLTEADIAALKEERNRQGKAGG